MVSAYTRLQCPPLSVSVRTNVGSVALLAAGIPFQSANAGDVPRILGFASWASSWAAWASQRVPPGTPSGVVDDFLRGMEIGTDEESCCVESSLMRAGWCGGWCFPLGRGMPGEATFGGSIGGNACCPGGKDVQVCIPPLCAPAMSQTIEQYIPSAPPTPTLLPRLSGSALSESLRYPFPSTCSLP
jgi:hypothetical protein